jgi:cysteine-rich repeat protein
MQRASDIPSSYVAALVADDDDGNLGNGTPHQCLIEQAFGRHGLAGDGFQTTTIAPPVAEGLAITVGVTTPVTACPQPRVTRMTLHWHVGASTPQDVAFADHGDHWSASLPSLPDGTVVLYTITAELDDGAVDVLPNNAADPLYQLYVGTTFPIACESFDRDPQWTQGGTFANRWEWGVPGVNPLSGDPTAAHTGTAVLGTDVTHDGIYDDNATILRRDSADRRHRYQGVRLQDWRWLTVEDAMWDQAAIGVNGVEVWHNAMGDGDLDHLDREWRFHDVELTPQIATGSAVIRWTLISNSGRAMGGWNLDDVCVVGTGKFPRCGDGIVDTEEECDDGNTADGDGCSSACSREGDAGCCSAQTRPEGPLFLALGVIAVIRRRRR